MKALLVQPRAPNTYWGFQHSLGIAGSKAALPPLGLISLAALLPRKWELRLRDLNVAPLGDEDLRWADAVLVSGMLVHERSMHEVLARARALGKRTVVGGPAATTSPAAFAGADHLFRGEAEGRIARLVSALERPQETAPRDLSTPGESRPSMSDVPVPRFGLLDLGAYHSMSVQYSRGCPFQCEFCDVIEIFGRTPRVKSSDQMLAELEALGGLGWRGPLFFVDDNFIGNRRAVAELLPRLAAWQGAHGRPFDLYTEASVDLATRPDLVRAMVEAGFSSVFLGIETPSGAALREAGKSQNLRMDPGDAVRVLTAAGIEVFAGFIVGFDSDGPGIFDAQADFISSLPIPLAMAGLLTALPGTALWRRMEREGRLRGRASGDQFDRPNFEPAMDERALLEGYRRLLAHLYAPGPYYARCERLVESLGKPGTRHRFPRSFALLLAGNRSPVFPRGALTTFARACWHIGVRSPRRRRFWRLLRKALLRAPHAFARAVALAVLGEHLIRYTREDVLPRLDRALAEIPHNESAPRAAAAATR